MDQVNFAQADQKLPAANVRPQTHLDGIVTRLASVTGDLKGLEAQLVNMHDRAFGAAPEKDASAQAREVRTGTHGQLSDRVDDIENIIARLRARIEHLSAFV